MRIQRTRILNLKEIVRSFSALLLFDFSMLSLPLSIVWYLFYSWPLFYFVYRSIGVSIHSHCSVILLSYFNTNNDFTVFLPLLLLCCCVRIYSIHPTHPKHSNAHAHPVYIYRLFYVIQMKRFGKHGQIKNNGKINWERLITIRCFLFVPNTG